MYHTSDDNNKPQELWEAYLADDLFDVKAGGQRLILSESGSPDVLPAWLDTARLLCLLIGASGIFATFLSIGALANLIASGLVLNLTILLALSGFASYFIYPYLLKYTLANGVDQSKLLHFLNGYMLVFSTVLFLILMTWPIAGLGLALILLPAPISVAMTTRKYLSRPIMPSQQPGFSFLALFDYDLRRIAWISFFTALMALFSILILLGI